ncbi:MAG: phenylalanyl-tRNA synthetase beta chain [Polaribacter sp.]|jgi:phenylalanyl-tRNA synthetase beta chain
MIISEQWLRDWVHVDLNAQQIADCLTNAGLEVDGVESLAGSIDNLVIGKILEVSKHPDADRLNLTKVDIGGEQLDIVCGASNVRPDLLVAVATVGAKLPNGLKIKKAKVRGIESNGMLCSASELGLADSSDGIMELDEDAIIGQRVDEYLQLDDSMIDIDLTPNRGDCLSVQGIARELKVLADGDYHPLDIQPIEATIDDHIEIDLQAKEACPAYIGRVIKGVNPIAQTPIWMQERLRRSGVRPISPVVDITNYVMLELGQPMHAFDLAKLNEKIIIRQSIAGEKITLLDDSTATLDADTLVIADTAGAIAIAGVMGGLDSSIDDNTSTIVLEAAHFTRKTSAGRARRYGLHTESSHRFERGVDPQLPHSAMQRATELVLAICGGEAGPVNQQLRLQGLTSKPAVAIRLPRLQQLLGMKLDSQEVASILGRIADSITATDDGWSITPPSYRFDIECEADLVEEVARVKGYDNIPTAIPRIAPRSVAASEDKVDLRKLRQTLVARDYNEAITYSFVDPEAQKLFSEEEPVALSNPLAVNLSVMRTSLLPGLMAALQFNANRQHDRIRLFEIGASYHKKQGSGSTGVVEVQRLAGVISGPLIADQWGVDKSKSVDFYDIKADIEAVLGLTGQKQGFIFNGFEHIALHPGQVASVTYSDGMVNLAEVSLRQAEVSLSSAQGSDQEDSSLGFIGRLHPSLQKLYGLANAVFVFEVDLDKSLIAELPSFKAVSKFPSSRRDLSILVNQQLPVSSLLHSLSRALGKSLVKSQVFDVYQGAGVKDGSKSVSLSLVLQHQDKTMTDEDAEDLMKKALSVLENEHQAQLRS